MFVSHPQSDSAGVSRQYRQGEDEITDLVTPTSGTE